MSEVMSMRPALKRRLVSPWTARRWAPALFLAPFIVLFGVFGVFPLLFSLWLSLHQWNPAAGFAAMRWVGLDNYAFTLADPWFHRSLLNTLWYAIGTGVPQHAVALPLAWLVHRAIRSARWRDVLVGIYFLPFIASSVAIALVFSTLYSKDYGVINAVLHHLLGGPSIDWINEAAWVKPAVGFVVFWRYLGWNVVLYLSALQVVDAELYEAAALDGAGPWRQFFHVALPQLKPMIFFAVTLTIIGNLQLFEEPFILVDSESPASRAAMTSAGFMYQLAFAEGDFGTASAVSWLLFALIALAAWLNARLFRGSGASDATI
jgi:multiple sugar transport system permease protein